MSAPAVIDSLEFARSAQSISGSLPIASLKRLDDLLVDADGSVSYALLGSRDERNRPQLELRIEGRLHLQCQRCLSLLDYPVDITSVLLIVPHGVRSEDDMDDPQAPDAIEASAELDVGELIEDEVLLALPLAPRHRDGACASGIATPALQAAKVESAFAKLAALRRPLDKH